MSIKVTEKIVEHTAELARLEVAGADMDRIKEGMQTILNLAEAMQSVDTAKVAPLANPLDAVQQLGFPKNGGRGGERSGKQESASPPSQPRLDAVTETDQRATFQGLAPATEDGLYLVPKVVE